MIYVSRRYDDSSFAFTLSICSYRYLLVIGLVTVTLPPNSITELLVHCCEFVRMVAVMSALTPSS